MCSFPGCTAWGTSTLSASSSLSRSSHIITSSSLCSALEWQCTKCRPLSKPIQIQPSLPAGIWLACTYPLQLPPRAIRSAATKRAAHDVWTSKTRTGQTHGPQPRGGDSRHQCPSGTRSSRTGASSAQPTHRIATIISANCVSVVFCFDFP